MINVFLGPMDQSKSGHCMVRLTFCWCSRDQKICATRIQIRSQTWNGAVIHLPIGELFAFIISDKFLKTKKKQQASKMPVMLVRGVGDCLSWKQVVRSLCHHAASSKDATLPVTVESPQGKDAQNCSPIGRTRPLMAWRKLQGLRRLDTSDMFLIRITS